MNFEHRCVHSNPFTISFTNAFPIPARYSRKKQSELGLLAMDFISLGLGGFHRLRNSGKCSRALLGRAHFSRRRISSCANGFSNIAFALRASTLSLLHVRINLASFSLLIPFSVFAIDKNSSTRHCFKSLRVASHQRSNTPAKSQSDLAICFLSLSLCKR